MSFADGNSDIYTMDLDTRIVENYRSIGLTHQMENIFVSTPIG